jgi:hypothetical protein
MSAFDPKQTFTSWPSPRRIFVRFRGEITVPFRLERAVPICLRVNGGLMPNHASNKSLQTAEGPHFSGLISELGSGEWRAIAWIREPDLSLKQTIGPKILGTAQMARHWLSELAAKQGFDNINIVVERPRYEDLIAEDDA